MASPRFFVLNEFNGEQQGPYTVVELCELIEKRKLKKKTLVAREGQNQWSEAGVALAKLFSKVEQKKKDAKERSRIEKEERRAERKAEKQKLGHPPDSLPNIVDESVSDKSKSPETSPPKIRTSRHQRQSWRANILRAPKASPYWGFTVVATLINIAIVLTAISSASAFLFYLILPTYAAFNSELDIVSFIIAILVIVLTACSCLIIGLVWIVLQLFYRNVLDWLIDIESHLRKLSENIGPESHDE